MRKPQEVSPKLPLSVRGCRLGTRRGGDSAGRGPARGPGLSALANGAAKVSVGGGGQRALHCVRGPSRPSPQTAEGPPPEEEARAGVQQAPPGNPQVPRRQA